MESHTACTLKKVDFERKEMPRNIAILDTFITLQQYGSGGLEVIYKNTVIFLRGPKIALMPKGDAHFNKTLEPQGV